MTDTKTIETINFSLDTLRSGYLNKDFNVVDVVKEVIRRIKNGQDAIWTQVFSEEALIKQAESLLHADISRLPLFGIPFSVKDNIHALGLTTTASCESLAYIPEKNAESVQLLLDAGAILVGKNTLDQFATGLVGVRSPKHPVNSFNPEYIPGGSSSGSAVAVASGLVSFSLGSDTGGSGRIPAALNNIVGFKPTPGLISVEGMIYANRTFDCIPIFSLLCSDAKTVFDLIYSADCTDPYCGDYLPQENTPALSDFSSQIVAIPSAEYLNFFGDEKAKAAFALSVERMKGLGAKVHEIDFSSFIYAGKKLFDGPLLSERYASIQSFIKDESLIEPSVKAIIEKAKQFSAVDLCEEIYEIIEIRAKVRKMFTDFDLIMVPTAPTIYKVSELKNDPISLNTNMGYYTYFANILNLSALALPSEIRSDGLPFGICLIGGPREDEKLLHLGEQWQLETKLFLGNRLGFIA